MVVLSKIDIENEVFNILNRYDESLLEFPREVPIEVMAETYWNLQIEYQTLSEEEDGILGLTTFTAGVIPVYDREEAKWRKIFVPAGTIIIDDSLLDDSVVPLGRFRFTFAHEIAHWHLHRYDYSEHEGQLKLFSSNEQAASVKCLSRNIESNRLHFNQRKSPEDWIEWQADYMASALLMPSRAYKTAFKLAINKRGISIDSPLIYDDQNTMQKQIINELAQVFNVSRQAARIRLFNLGLLKRSNSPQGTLI